MDFFKSVFSDPTQEDSSSDPPTTTTKWAFGSGLLRTIASKSESLLDNYYKDLQEFSSGLRDESSLIRHAAGRAVQALPARLESGAALAQESLEAVGQAIDNVGSTVSLFIGKDFNFDHNDHTDDDDGNGVSVFSKDSIFDGKRAAFYSKDSIFSQDVKPYSRIDALIRGLQCDVRTYCDEVVEEEEEGGYEEWRKGFRVEERKEEIERVVEGNGVVKEIYDEVVPGRVEEEMFWCRYFFRVEKLVRAEEARARIVKKAILAEEEEEEELSWDVEDEDEGVEESGSVKGGEKGKMVKGDEDEAGVSGTKSGGVVDEENVEEGLRFDEKAGSEAKTESDFSVISSQRTSHAEDDFGWDEIEDIGDGDENKGNVRGSPDPSIKADLRKRLSAAEEDEELSWDIEDDDEPVKS